MADMSFAQPFPPTPAALSTELDSGTLERIFESVACETGMCMGEVRDAYAEGRVEVEKEGNEYLVTVVDTDGGGLSTILIEEGI